MRTADIFINGIKAGQLIEYIEMIDRSFLSEDLKEKYKTLLLERTSRLE